MREVGKWNAFKRKRFSGIMKVTNRQEMELVVMFEKEKNEKQQANGVYDEAGDVVNVYDAAVIYQANDYNDAYMYDFTHEQLMDALDYVP